MGVLTGLEPKTVFRYFEEICNIPHGSGNERQLSNYIKDFAEKRNLSCIQDEWNNIIVIKEATTGYEAEEPIILQGHMDMVAVKEPESDIDMSKDPLRLEIDGDYITARGTSLGGDDGIAVAYALALLDSNDIPHPCLEVIITVGEETGMDGAREIDLSMLKSKRLLNLDNEEEGILLTSCAGGARADCKLPVSLEKRRGITLKIQVSGLKGGHSGAEIIKEGGNANCIMGRVLDAIIQKTSASLVSIEGGLADNAIPIFCEAVIIVEKAEVNESFDIVSKIENDIQTELTIKDSGVTVSIKERRDYADITGIGYTASTNETASTETSEIQEEIYVNCLTPESMKKAVSYIMAMPNGIQAMSADVKNLVETSLNLGIMKLTGDTLLLEYSIRSSIESSKEALISKLKAISDLAGAEVEIRGDYPGWAYKQDSPLRDKMVRIYERMYGSKPRIEAIHAGLECGIISSKIKDLDCISYGPDMKDIHTTGEVLSISSVKRVWDYLLEILKDK
ncbi:MAG: aminoacyl-histidine dipeptidase [Lachnospiraceae bacterium]|nr:aminoacyl-histidine dipeptidase [Lachnospiraceae bacterium]